MNKNIQIIKKNDSSGKQSDPGNFFKGSICNFRCQKYVKKEYIEMTKKFTLRLLKSILGRSFSHHFIKFVIFCGAVDMRLGQIYEKVSETKVSSRGILFSNPQMF